MITFSTVIEPLPMMHSRTIEVRAVLHLTPIQAIALGKDFAESFAMIESSCGDARKGVQIASMRIGIFNPPKDKRSREYWTSLMNRDGEAMMHHPRRRLVPLLVKALILNSARIVAQEILIGSPHQRDANEMLHVLSYESDPHVDRGFIMAMMIRHVASVVSPNAALIYQPFSESGVPQDQKGRIGETFATVRDMGKRLGYEVIAAQSADIPEEVVCGAGMSHLELQRAKRKELPFLMAMLDPKATPEIAADIGPQMLVQAIDIGDWLTAKVRAKVRAKA